jgi:DNA modification methylase
VNKIILGDSLEVLTTLASASVDFVLTDPPYLVNYRDRAGRRVVNDGNSGAWLKPVFREMHRVLKEDSLCVSFYAWNKVHLFMDAWKSAGFRIVGHIVFRKRYASSVRFLRYEHESAFLLAKGGPALPAEPTSDVLDWQYTGNRLHPTQKPLDAFCALIRAFTKENDFILDPFLGSGTTALAAHVLNRRYVGIEIDEGHYKTALARLTSLN